MFKEVLQAFQEPSAAFMQSGGIQKLAEGKLTVAHYAQLMRQIFHQARENPQLQALATVHFRGPQRAMVSPFYRHAISEIGHDQLALNDFVACGGNAQLMPIENPHPATSAVTAFAFHQIQFGNPVGYLGYLFFLEFLPTTQGVGLMHALKATGVPDNAFTFLQDHVTVDEGHNKAMEKYCAALVKTNKDLAAVTYALKATGYLYTQMIEAAIDMADEPRDFGICYAETDRYGPIDLGR